MNCKRVDFPLTQLGINAQGLNPPNQKILDILIVFFKGGAAGLDALCAALSETRDTVEDVIEPPYLLQSGLIQRTPRGRKITENDWSLFNETSSLKTAPDFVPCFRYIIIYENFL